MRYKLIMPFGIFFIETELSIDEVKQQLHQGVDLHPIYDSNGNQMKTYPPKFFQSAEVMDNESLINLDEVPKDVTLGRMAMVYPFDKEEILSILKEMNLEPNDDSNEALQYFITENVEDFLTNYRNTTFIEGSISNCEIKADKGRIIFYSHEGRLMHPTKNRMFITGGSIIKFNDSERYQLCFKPT